MSNPWLRLYREALHDPKLVTLSDRQHRAWFNCLLIADDTGKLPSNRDVAVHMRTTMVEAEQLICDLVEAGLIDVDAMGGAPVYRMHGWSNRQYSGDSSAARMAKYRAKRKAAGLPTLSDYSKFKPVLVERDGYRCVYCLDEKKKLVVDHMIPITQGGTDEIDNLALACKECNSGKSGRTPSQSKMEIRVKSAAQSLLRYQEISDGNSDAIESEPDTETDTENKFFPSEQEPARAKRNELCFDIGLMNGKGKREDIDTIAQRAEGLGLDAADLLGTTHRAKPNKPTAYMTALCVNRLKERLPGLDEQILRDALWGKPQPFATVSKLLLEVQP